MSVHHQNDSEGKIAPMYSLNTVVLIDGLALHDIDDHSQCYEPLNGTVLVAVGD